MAETIPAKSRQHTTLTLNDPLAAERLARIAQVYIDHLGICRLEPVTLQAAGDSRTFEAIIVDEDGQGYIALLAGEQLTTGGSYHLRHSGSAIEVGEEQFVVQNSRPGLEQGADRIGYYVHIMRRLVH